MQRFTDTAGCVAALKRDGYDIWCTDLSASAEKFEERRRFMPLPARVAVVIGREKQGEPLPAVPVDGRATDQLRQDKESQE